MTWAYTSGATLVAANLQYSGIVFSALYGLFLFGDTLSVLGWSGMGLIIASGIAATVLRILFASIATQLLGVLGLILIGGFLLLWVCWKMWRELRDGHAEEEGVEAVTGEDLDADGTVGGARGNSYAQREPPSTLGAAARLASWRCTGSWPRYGRAAPATMRGNMSPMAPRASLFTCMS
jgi:hypothetical protein